jgi:hypothetical protein
MKVAVLPFSCSAPADQLGDADVGAGMAKVVSAEIPRVEGWMSVDQDAVAAVVNNSANKDLNAAEIGKLLGADAVITGEVQAFDFEQTEQRDPTAAASAAANMGALSSVPGVGAISGLIPVFQALGSAAQAVQRGHVKVSIEAKLIDVQTGRMISSLTGTATSKKGGTSLWGLSRPTSDFQTRTFLNSIAGQASVAAADDLCTQLAQARPDGFVADVDGNLVCLGFGKTDGLNLGDRLIVERYSESDKGARTHVAVIMVTDLSEHTAIATTLDGTPVICIGDTIRSERAKPVNLTQDSSNGSKHKSGK